MANPKVRVIERPRFLGRILIPVRPKQSDEQRIHELLDNLKVVERTPEQRALEEVRQGQATAAHLRQLAREAVPSERLRRMRFRSSVFSGQ